MTQPVRSTAIHAAAWLALPLLILPAAGAPARRRPPPAPPTHAAAAMPIDMWSALAPEPQDGGPAGARAGAGLDTTLPRGRAEEITVIGRRHRYEEDWRAELRRRDPTYEASNAASAQPLVPFPQWTSQEQQRLMSDKTEFLGLCGALGGYIQCPDRSP